MPWAVEWGNERSQPFATEWEAQRHGAEEGRRRHTGCRILDLAPEPGLHRLMLAPGEGQGFWRQVATYLAGRCDRFWLHWAFRPSNDRRSIWEQLIDPGARPEPEPLPPREQLPLGRLAPWVTEMEHSWMMHNACAISGRLDSEVLPLLLAREEVPWFDLHLIGQGRTWFLATDAGTEHFVQLTEDDLDQLAAQGVPRDLFNLR